MKKTLLFFTLTLVVCLGFLPMTAFAEEAELPDWYFLFAIFKNVDADCKDEHNVMRHTKYSMTQDEVNIIRRNARGFEEYMNRVGVMCAHVEVVEIDAVVTELQEYDGGSYLEEEHASFLLNGKVDLNRYDHVTCIASLNVGTSFLGLGGGMFENGTGHAFINFVNRNQGIQWFTYPNSHWPESIYVHEFLHFVERINIKWGMEFNEHLIGEKFYKLNTDEWKSCYTDIILGRVKGDAETGTGVFPAVWQYPPHVLRTMHELTIPSGVTSIGEWAFQGCSALTKVSIPASVTSIGAGAFQGCSQLLKVNILSGETAIGDYAFQKCAALTEVVIPAGVSSIGAGAFQGCSQLLKVEIPSGETAIGDYAFQECAALTEVVVPAGVSSIGAGAFQGCSQLLKIEIPSGETAIGEYAFQGCTALTEVMIPSGVTGIGEWAFQGCSALTRVSIPASVASIGEVAFYETGLKEVYYDGTEAQWKTIQIGEYNRLLTHAIIYYIPSGVTVVEDYAFQGCTTLTELRIPSSIISIRTGAFQDCSQLTKVDIPSGVATIGDAAFERCTALTEVVIPSGVTSIGAWAFQGCSQLLKVEIPSGETAIGDYAFQGCTALTEVMIPAGVTSIGAGAFQGCTALTEVMIPSSVTDIGAWAFQDCSQLTRVDILSGVVTIGDAAFRGCTTLTEMVIPSGVTSIGEWAFQGCSVLTRVSIPVSIASIGEVAFYETGLKHVYYDGTEAQWNAIQIGEYNSSLTQAIIHYSGAGWEMEDGKHYWYEKGVRQGYAPADPSYCGKEIFDPESNAWYWLDNDQQGAKAISKDVYQESAAGQWAEDAESGTGKWVRYDADGHMVKGWSTNENGIYYFDPEFGTMAKGIVSIDGKTYEFDRNTGVLLHQDGWETEEGKQYWYENGIRQGYAPADPSYRGKEIFDPESNAWYWLDNDQQGAKAVSKDVYQESAAGQWAEDAESGTGKWVRYDVDGHMVKGWNTNENGTYYFDPEYGTMAKGTVTIDGRTYSFDMATGILQE